MSCKNAPALFFILPCCPVTISYKSFKYSTSRFFNLRPDFSMGFIHLATKSSVVSPNSFVRVIKLEASA